MSEDIKQMRKRHEKEIEELQANCKHTIISDWMPYWYAPAHFSHYVKMCETCGKSVEEHNLEPIPCKTITNTSETIWHKSSE